jgi:hypothetical protein
MSLAYTESLPLLQPISTRARSPCSLLFAKRAALVRAAIAHDLQDV